MRSEIAIRPLDAWEWSVFRELRLRALKTEPGIFYSSHEEELRHGAPYWRDAVTGNGKHQVFGLFDGSKLIGITAAFTYRGDPTGETAFLAMSFIEPQYRGQGLSRVLYEARLDWIRNQPQFRRVTVSHRESNEASRRANQAFGFRYVARESHMWPDGGVEDEITYELQIAR